MLKIPDVDENVAVRASKIKHGIFLRYIDLPTDGYATGIGFPVPQATTPPSLG
jgi:hypothetical protein